MTIKNERNQINTPFSVPATTWLNGMSEFFFSLKMFLLSKMSFLVLEIRENAIINPDLMHNFLIQSTFPTVPILQPSLIYFSLGSGITS